MWSVGRIDWFLGLRKMLSMNFRVEMWSKVSWQTYPPALNGEMTSAGVRKPRPTGPCTLSQSDGGPPAAFDGLAVITYSPSRYPPAPAAAGMSARVVTVGPGVGGETWSKKPPFSS